MADLVTLTHAGGIGVITIHNPPVNALSPGVPEGIEAGLDRAAADPSVRGIVLIGGGRTFIAGADIHRLAEATHGPDFHDLLQKMEDCAKPLVIAIHGAALGGGLEFAMAGHYRVAAADAQVGQPEVNLGLIPGAEGTQRLPRLAGIAKAIDMCVGGAPVKAREALAAGIVDAIIDGDLLAGAIAFADERAAQGGPHPKTRERNGKLGSPGENGPLYAAGRDQARRIRRNQMAPLKAVDAIEAAVTLPYEQGCRRERELFNECITSDQAKAMMHAFLAEREAAKLPGVTRHTPVLAIERAGVVGAGATGAGIAMTFANAGIAVWIKETDPAALERAMAAIRDDYEGSVREGRSSRETMDQRMALIHPALTYEGFDQAGMIVEAAPGSMALKKQIFAEIGGVDGVAKPDCILATSDSAPDLDQIASAAGHPENVLGLNFLNAAPDARLVEIMRGKATGIQALATALSLAKKLRKVGVVVGNGPGFAGERMLLAYLREAQFLVEEGASPEQVDRVLTDWGMGTGVSLAAGMGVLEAAGRVKQEYKHLFEQTARESGIAQRAIGDEEILDRCIYRMANEAARILEEGHATRAGDLDTICLAGYGFPAYRGGPLWYADTVGLAKVYARIQEFHRRHGERWAPAALLERLADGGRTFASLDK